MNYVTVRGKKYYRDRGGYLDLSGLGIREIKEIEGLEELTSLESLFLHNNQISDIEGLDKLAKFSGLGLNLNGNQIKEIKGLDNLINLYGLGLAKNQISEIKGLDKLKNLHNLYLENNRINEIKGLRNLNNLESLVLTANQITEIKNIDTLTNLNFLDLINNKIKEIKGLDALINLTQLHLNSNRITEIKGLGALTNLKILGISNNPIKQEEQHLLTPVIVQEIVSYCRNKNNGTPLQKKTTNLNKNNEEENLFAPTNLNKKEENIKEVDVVEKSSKKNAPRRSKMKSLKELVEKHDLMDYYEELAKMTRKMIRIKTKKSNDNRIKIGESKMGGDPDLPEDVHWPECEWPDSDNESLLFLAQINLAEISKFEASEFPVKEGILYFFYSRNQDINGIDPGDKDGWRVIYSNNKTDQLKRTPYPLENWEEFEKFTPCKLSFSEDISLPYFQSTMVEQLFGDDDRYFELWSEFIEERGLDWEGGDQKNDHQLFGHAFPAQDEMEFQVYLAAKGVYIGDISDEDYTRIKDQEREPYKWRLLLQIDTDDNPKWMWGDMGKLYFWINEDDLQKNKYDDVWMISQCG